MATFTVTPLEVEPYFDLELLMSTSQETRIGGDMMDQITEVWERWLPHAKAWEIKTGDTGYLLVRLGDVVENEVDDKWEQTPSEAFIFNALAQVMCMGMVHAVLPQVEDAGCAPAPRPTGELAEALESVGVSYITPGEPGLSCRYGVVTGMPFKGGCEICALREGCPKAGGAGAGPSSIVLPGFE